MTRFCDPEGRAALEQLCDAIDDGLNGDLAEPEFAFVLVVATATPDNQRCVAIGNIANDQAIHLMSQAILAGGQVTGST